MVTLRTRVPPGPTLSVAAMESTVPVRVPALLVTVTTAAWPTRKSAASAAWKGSSSFMWSRSSTSAMGAPAVTVSPCSTCSSVITPASSAVTLRSFWLSLRVSSRSSRLSWAERTLSWSCWMLFSRSPASMRKSTSPLWTVWPSSKGASRISPLTRLVTR